MKLLPIDSRAMAVSDHGAGLAAVFVHGFPLDHSMWDAQVAAVAVRHRAIAPDLRGFGRSDGGETATSIDDFADDLARLLDALAIDRAVLCGLSMGGYVALAFARKRMDRLRGLVLCDTRAAADSPEAAAARLAAAERAEREGTAFLVETMLPKLLAPNTLARRPDLVARVEAMLRRADPRAVAAAQRGMAQRPDSRDLLPQIPCPTLVLVGQNDVLSPPEEMRTLARDIPDARFVQIAAAGHLAPLENPDETNAALRAFLGEVDDA